MRGLPGLAVITILIGCAACADPDAGSATFIERLGSDTIAVEQLSWTGSSFEGTVVVRSPETALVDYWGSFAGGRMLEYGTQWRSPGAGPEVPPLTTASVVWIGDTAVISRRDESGSDEIRVWSPPDVVPLPGRIPPPPLLAYAPVGAWRQIVRHMLDATDAPFVLGLGTPTPQAVTQPSARWGDDSVGIRVIDGWTVARLDPNGELSSISGHGTTMAIDVERARGALDLNALALEYAARDARGEGFGIPSPTARLAASVGSATINITYGRPSKRGRQIWGGLVPYDQVWRTGANLATHLETDRDLMIGDTPVPAGTYTLWTMVRPDGVELIISRLTNVWGTQYAPEQDLARIPMRRDMLDDPIERFTIDVQPEADSPGTARARLLLTWDRTRFSVPISVR